MELFNNVAVTALSKNLDGLWAREKVISENIANLETPGYKRKYVSFEEELLSKIQDRTLTGDQLSSAIDSVGINENVDNAGTLREDGNNVDIEVENIEMARTQINYSYSVKNLDDYFSRLRSVINGG